MKAKVKKALIGLTLLLIVGTAWITYICITRPITHEMVHIEGYYKWTQGEGTLTHPIFLAFTRDGRFRESLRGTSTNWLHSRFPHITNGKEYPDDCYRSENSPKKSYGGVEPDEILWLNGYKLNPAEEGALEGVNSGYCALIKEGKILEFRWVKG